MRAEGNQCSRCSPGSWDQRGLSGDPGHLWSKASSCGESGALSHPKATGGCKIGLGQEKWYKPRAWGVVGVSPLRGSGREGASPSLEYAGEMESRALSSLHQPEAC